MVRSTGFVKETKAKVADSRRALAQPALKARQTPDDAVHSTGTEAIGRGRSSSRLAEVNRVKKPARRQWQRPSQLPSVPVDVIPGHRVRYNRIDGKNRGDRRNVEARLREGWELCRHDELPEEYKLPSYSLTRYGEVVGNDDMVLMKLHEDLVEQRNAEYQGRTIRQTKGVNDTLREMGQKTGLRARINVKTHTDIPGRRSVRVRGDDGE